MPLLRNCGRIDVILPEWFEITGPSLAVSRLEVDAETQSVLASIRSERRGATELWPVFNLGGTLTAEAFLLGLNDVKRRSDLVDRVVRTASGIQADGACLRLQGVKAKGADILVPFVAEL